MKSACSRSVFAILILSLSCSAAFAQTAPSPAIKLMPGVGNVHHHVSTTNAQAQAFFDQGMDFIYGFNHVEAEKSFRRAAELDPNLGMAYWGVAKALGPNYNLPVDPAREKQAYDAIQKAEALAKNAPQMERDYIQALAQRFTSDPSADLHQLDRNYRDAMRALSQKYPDDLDAATLSAEAGMDLNPWRLWNADGSAAPGTEEVVATLESVLKRDPNHMGANHYYIHAVEASAHPERALPCADRLGALAPASGHLVHMPAHTYIRTGNHEQSAQVNEKAATADETLLKATNEQGIYPMMYYTHNLHFITMADSMMGRYADALKAAHRVEAHVSPMAKQVPMLDGFMPIPTLVMVRFRRWSDILSLPAPPAGLPMSNGIYHYARGLAFANQGKEAEARAELAELEKLAPEMSKIPTNPTGAGNAQKIPKIAAELIQARLAKSKTETVDHLRAGVALQDSMDYTEPPDWFYPVRESLGAALLENGQAAEAEKVFREDLERNPRNGRSLFGLRESLKAEGKAEDAEAVDQQFKSAWKNADSQLKLSEL